MAELLAVLLEIFFTVVLEVGGETAITFGVESLAAPFKRTRESSLGLAFSGIILISALSAALFHLAIPNPIFKPSKFQGISLLVSPLITGYCLHRFGIWRHSNGKPTTRIATFWGGALFAFTFSLVRFLSVKHL